MVVALPLFLQNVDTSIMGTALPTIADALHVDALRLNLAITAYLISLAIFLPASGWIADRFGPRRVFCGAIALFSAASGLCGLATSLEMLVACRVLQGIGGAMMVPVGRLILLRSVAPGAMVAAMVWFTVPPAFGRLIGPLMGGITVTWFSWRWIFLINVPLGILGIVLALALLNSDEVAPDPPSFDGLGFLLMGVGLASLLASLESTGSQLVERSATAALAAFGAACLIGYWLHSRRTAAPLIDLRIIRHPTFFASLFGGFPLRLAIGAVPFLLPLLFQLGFGLSPLDSGLLTMGTALGSLATRAVLTPAIDKAGFRPLLLGATVCSSLCYVAYGTFKGSTPHALLFAALVAGGLVISMVMVSLQTLAFSEIPERLMGHATALSTMAQQLSLSLGVLFAVALLRLSVWGRDGDPNALLASDFPLAFFSIAATVLVALVFFLRLPADVGSEFRGG
jgi:EmrB/QacA subfamily drug resistance transporter